MYLPKGKYCVYPRMVYRLAIVMPPPPPNPILDDRKSLSIAFLAISNQYSTFICFLFCSQYGCRRPYWMTKNPFQSHFSPFQISVGVRRQKRQRRRRHNQKHNIIKIFKFRGYNYSFIMENMLHINLTKYIVQFFKPISFITMIL